MDKYCIYLRKSRADMEAELRGEGETLERHKKALLELANKQMLNILEIYPEVVSGETIASRPVMQQLLSEVEQGAWTGVLVMEVERLARGDTIDQGIVSQAFKYSGTKIITPVKVYDPNNEYDEEYFEFGLFMSRREYKTINRRLQRGRIQSVKEGKYLGTNPPYGYIRKKLVHEKGYTLEINPEQTNIIKMIFELYTRGEQQPDGSVQRLGVGLIVRKLNNLKVLPCKGDVWVNATLHDILRNPIYIGKVRWNWRPTVKKIVDGQVTRLRPRAKLEDCILVDGLHEPIVDEQTWNLAQEYLAKNPAKPVPADKKTKNPLSGIVVCGICGRKLVRRPYTNRPQEDTLMCPVTSCSNISSKLRIVEAHILDSLEVWLHNFKMQWAEKSTPGKSENIQKDLILKGIKKLDEELNKLKIQMESLHDLLEQKVYDTETFLKRSKIISERINEIIKDKMILTGEIEREAAREVNQKMIIPKFEKVLKLYKSIEDPQQKNDLLKEVIEKVVYTKKAKFAKKLNDPDDFELILYPKITN